MTQSARETIQKSLKRRFIVDKLTHLVGIFAILFSLSILAWLFINTAIKGIPAFWTHKIGIEVTWSDDILASGEIEPMIAIDNAIEKIFNTKDTDTYYDLFTNSLDNDISHIYTPNKNGKTETIWLRVSSNVDMFLKGNVDETFLTPEVFDAIIKLQSENKIETVFNTKFFTGSDSRNAEDAGLASALVGSFYVMILTLIFSFVIGVGAAIFLEEFAPPNIITTFVEANINNLGAIPSIVYGLLGLAFFINIFDLPRSSSLVAAMVLTLMTLPTIIISSRAAIKSVPRSLRDAAYGIGASKFQVVFHHVLPSAMPGVFTGIILGMARALGETAPLIMIGMIAFIPTIPTDIFSPAVVMPVQIFLWATIPEIGYVEKSSAAILILLFFLIIMNGLVIYLRTKFERKN